MKHEEIIDRYVYAVGKQLSYRTRTDIEKEITTLIYDMLEERCGDLPIQEKDVRVVLAELGKPEELANQYSPDKDKCLIGQPYYSKYKMIMKIITLSVLLGMVIAGAVDISISFFGRVASIAEYAGQLAGWIRTAAAGIVASFAIVTGAFAFLQWKRIPLSELGEGTWENRPRPSIKKEHIGKAEPIARMTLSVVFLVIFMFAPQIACVITENTDGGTSAIPLLNVVLVKKLWYFTAAFFILGIIRDAYSLFAGKHTMKTAAVRGICNVLSFIVCAVWLTQYNLINTDFISILDGIKDNEIIILLFQNFQLFFLSILTFALILDFADSLFRALKNKRQAEMTSVSLPE